MEFATKYPPYFKSWNHFYNAVLGDEAQDDEEYSWNLEPVRYNNMTRLYHLENSPYRYKVRYIQQQALTELRAKTTELRAKTFDWEQTNILYQATQRYAMQFENSVFHDRLKPLLDKLQQLAKK